MFWLGVALLLAVPVATIVTLMVVYFYICHRHLEKLIRIFIEKPLFIIPRGQPPAEAEDISFPATDGLTLRACYLKTTSSRRRGVIVFGLEFGANRWSCVPYTEHLREAGFDVFAYEPRNQGDSDRQPGYEPLQWVTDRDTADCRAALAYVKSRPDADPRGVGLFGLSKGGTAGLVVAADDSYIRCVLTDGAFATYSTMVPYIVYWYTIYIKTIFHGLIGPWYFGFFARKALRLIERDRGVRYIKVERAARKLAPRPLFMIHGEEDSYIKPSMARALFDCARPPKEFWLVPAAKHNQAFHLVGDVYRRRVLEFFDRHLGNAP